MASWNLWSIAAADSQRGRNTVIDDAFNSNPRGAEAALNVLKDFPGRRIIVTPGMVELGTQEAEFNRELGRFMADKNGSGHPGGEKAHPAHRGGVGGGRAFPRRRFIRWAACGKPPKSWAP